MCSIWTQYNYLEWAPLVKCFYSKSQLLGFIHYSILLILGYALAQPKLFELILDLINPPELVPSNGTDISGEHSIFLEKYVQVFSSLLQHLTPVRQTSIQASEITVSRRQTVEVGQLLQAREFDAGSYHKCKNKNRWRHIMQRRDSCEYNFVYGVQLMMPRCLWATQHGWSYLGVPGMNYRMQLAWCYKYHYASASRCGLLYRARIMSAFARFSKN